MKYIIFDVDGTLIDSEQMYWQSLEEVAIKNGYSVTYNNFHKAFGKTMKDSLELVRVGPELLPAWKAMLLKYNNTITLFTGIRSVLAKLFENEQIMTGIATSETLEEFQNNVATLDISQYFNALTFFSEVKRGKPSPDMIELSMQKLKTLSEQQTVGRDNCIYIGDTYSDLIAAHAANVLFGLAGWSVDKGQERLYAEADYVFESPNDICEF